MAVYFVTGKLGAGKSLASVGRIQEYLQAGRMVATNLDLNLDKLLSPRNKTAEVYRLPDKPERVHFLNLPIANETYDEDKNGLICLDECGTWFNARNWNDKSRQPMIDWLLHARKYGWDVIFIVQDISIVDKQAREALCEHLVVCRRLDRISVPILSPIFKVITGKRLPFPRIHMAKVHYGDNEQAVKVDRWVYRGTSLYHGYDTKQIFTADNDGFSQVLCPWLIAGRYRLAPTWQTVFIKLLLHLVTPVLTGILLIAAVASGRRPGATASKQLLLSNSGKVSRYVSDGYQIG